MMSKIQNFEKKKNNLKKLKKRKVGKVFLSLPKNFFKTLYSFLAPKITWGFFGPKFGPILLPKFHKGFYCCFENGPNLQLKNPQVIVGLIYCLRHLKNFLREEETLF